MKIVRQVIISVVIWVVFISYYLIERRLGRLEQENVVLRNTVIALGNREEMSARTEYLGEFDVTAYNSVVSQTDDTPFMTASGLDLYQELGYRIVACNFLHFGQMVWMALPGDYEGWYIVADRMKEGSEGFDIWIRDLKEAKRFGRCRAMVWKVEETK